MADSAGPPCSGSSLAHSDPWMHPRRTSPPLSSPSSSLDLPQPAPLPHPPPYQFPSVLSVPLPPSLENRLSSPSPLPVPRQIHRARFLSLFCGSCEGNLEGLSGINLKGKSLSLLLSLALSADWVRSPGTSRLLISTAPTHPLLESFCRSVPLKNKKRIKSCSTF